MENIADIAKARQQREDETGKPVEIAPSLKGILCRAPSVPVLAERNVENNQPIANSTNKMVSPVLLKLRRNQQKRVTTANPVNPVQVPPKQFQGFPADRYMSPTDSIMSPISRGLLARNRRLKRLPPAMVPPKALDHTFQDAELANGSSSKSSCITTI